MNLKTLTILTSSLMTGFAADLPSAAGSIEDLLTTLSLSLPSLVVEDAGIVFYPTETADGVFGKVVITKDEIQNLSNTLFQDAVTRRDERRIIELFSKGIKPDQSVLNSALDAAITTGDIPMGKTLFNIFFPRMLKQDDANCALENAARRAHNGIIKALFNQQINLGIRPNEHGVNLARLDASRLDLQETGGLIKTYADSVANCYCVVCFDQGPDAYGHY